MRLCMRNKILRSANAKYHYSYFFFYIINKGNLPLMHSCVFWCEFIYEQIDRGQTKTQENIKGKSPLFIL